MPKRISATKRNQVIKAIQRGVKPTIIAEKYGVKRNTVYNWQRRVKNGEIEVAVSGPAEPKAPLQQNKMAELERENMRLKAQIYDLLHV